MIRKKIWVLMLLVGGCTLSSLSASNADSQQIRKSNNKSSYTRRIKSQPDSTISALLADGFKTIDKMAAEKQMLDEASRKAEIEERLNYPSVDLYGESSWGEYVNPFIGCSEKIDIPESYDIDCNGFVSPLNGACRVTSNYGYRPRYRRQHKGIDLHLRTGDTIYAAFDGKIRVVDYEGKGYGKYVIIRHDNGLETVYAHMSQQLVKKNDIVYAGDPIGLGGSTGRSTGPHLHFETRFMGVPINPAEIVDFNLGVPQKDVYTFFRKGHQVSTSKVAPSHRTKGKTNRGNKANIAVHRIRKGDTLSGIAKRYGITVSKICKLNNISSRAVLRPGKTLRVS